MVQWGVFIVNVARGPGVLPGGLSPLGQKPSPHARDNKVWAPKWNEALNRVYGKSPFWVQVTPLPWGPLGAPWAESLATHMRHLLSKVGLKPREGSSFLKILSGIAALDLIFEDFVYFPRKIKQLWTKYPMDLIRNIPRNSRITVLFQ